jgi:arsenate reductase
MVLFACVHNAGRSQMAAAFFNAIAPEGWVGESAGTQPSAAVHPEVVTTMREVGVDLSAGTPRLLTTDTAQLATLLVTMGCGEDCPYVPGLRRLDWALPDPKGQPPSVVRRIRNDIRDRVAALVKDLGQVSPNPH